MKSICVFCGANLGTRDAYRRAASQLGRLMAERGISLIYGGGQRGLMGVLADSVLDAGGHVAGVIPQRLVNMEKAHPKVQEMHIVNTMMERKAKMAELSDAYICLPGGLGTLDEMTEMLTWNQLGFASKPVALLNVEGFFDKLLQFLEFCQSENFIPYTDVRQIIVETDAETLLRRLSSDNYAQEKAIPINGSTYTV